MRGGNAQDRRRSRRAASRLVSAKTAPNDFAVNVVEAPEEDWAAIEAIVAEAEELGGDPKPGTPPDRRLKRNKPKAKMAEEAALDAFDVQLPALYAAAGDVAWGPEEGFVDLIADLNEAFSGGGAAADETASEASYSRVIDVSVKLDKALVCSGDGYMVAPLSISRDGEPTLGPPESWVPVESGWIESAPDADGDEATTAAGTLRINLRDFVLAAADVALPEGLQPAATLPAPNSSPAAPEPVATLPDGVAWEALFLPEAALTDDGRAFAPGAVSWRDLPLSLMAMTETSAQGGHDGAVLAGRIDRIWREGNFIRAAGIFDSGEFGQDVARMVADGTLRGLSVDTAIHEYKIGPRSDFFTPEGDWIEAAPEADEAEPDVLDLLFGGESEDAIFVVTKAVIGMATVCPFPAFAEANISLAASGAIWTHTHQGGFIVTPAAPEPLVAAAAPAADEVIDDAEAAPVVESLTAGAAGLAPVAPPAEWFNDPELEELTALTVTDDGRIYGHAWTWDTCHISFQDSCVLAPRTQSGNAYFHLGEIECEDGETLSVGKITLDAQHAGQRASRTQASRHYDDTGTVAAHVRCGEDRFGGWVSGAISPDLSEEKLRLLRGASLSGDWRAVKTNGASNLELVALLAVNVPGFPVPRQPKALVAAGDDGAERLSLVAAGVVTADVVEAEQLEEIASLAASATAPCVSCEELAQIGEEARRLAESV